MHELEMLIPIALFAMIGYITRVISDNRLIRKLADSPHISEATAARLLANRERQPGSLASLKWGLVVLALGLSILFVTIVGLDFDNPVTYGFVLFSAGIGLVSYYFIAREEEHREPESAAPARSASTSTPEQAPTTSERDDRGEGASGETFDPEEAYQDAS
jgi:hypothetical protein